MAAKAKQYVIYDDDGGFQNAFFCSTEEVVEYLREEYGLGDDEFDNFEVYEITSKPMKIYVTTKIEVK